MSSEAFSVLNWITVCISAVLLLMDTYLLGFHIFLICRQTSTYKYLKEQ